MAMSLRTRILAAMLAAVVLTDALAIWAVNDRIVAGAQREAASQARARAAQVQALYAERAATLAAESEAVSLYPAVIAALADHNAKPLLQWSSQVATLQHASVTVVDATGLVIARGHAPQQAGDNLGGKLAGLPLALAGQKVAGSEEGDELGLAVRGYAPARQNGAVVGAVMIADPLDDQLLARLGGEGSSVQLRVLSDTTAPEGCDPPVRAAAACRFPLFSPTGQPVATLAVTVPLADVEQARVDAQRALFLTGLLVLLVGAVAAWLLAGSLTRALAGLTAASQRIAGGDYDQPVGAGGADEIGILARAFETMRQRVAAATGALRHERDVLDAVLEATGDGILMVDGAGNGVVENRRWADLLGGNGLAAAADLARAGGGQRFADAVPGWLADPERVVGDDFERFDPYRHFRAYSAPVRHRDGTALGRIVVVRDVTRESEAERMRTALVATVSHELRSPLTAIAGYTDSLLHHGPWDDATAREFLDVVAQSAAKLAQLVDNLLDAAKMEAGVLQVEREPVRLERIAERLVAQRRLLAPDHPLHLDVAPDLPLAHADPFRVEQVLANLLDNAVKYSPDGGSVEIAIATTGDGTLVVSVRDHGIGIAPEHAERLFERFYRVDNALARTTKGIGLGLFICKGLVEAHGGRISVTSVPGEGSNFTFTLPAVGEIDGHADALAGVAAGAGPARRPWREVTG
jgi:signal transduction histidine kinase